MSKEYISFDIKTGMKNIIGRDLITDDYIAIYELVKNSYDAYADFVSITFKKDEIIILDNGKGMSEIDIKEKWFAVAYSAKKDGTEDNQLTRGVHLNNLKSRRFYAGAKGVGRFSCDRLGNSLELITTDFNSKQTCKVQVDWNHFEIDPKQSFGAIEIPFEKTDEIISYHKNKTHGTILRISKLNSNWTEEKIRGLKHSLEKVINPFSNQSDFSIEIIATDFLESDKQKTAFQKINGIITNSILSVLDIKTTQINVKVEKDKITTKVTDRGTLIYHIEEKNQFVDFIDDLDISLYFLNRSAKINFGKIMDIEPQNYGNVFLFKNGFRVQPYGNVGDDSWEIDKRKQQGYNRFLGTRDLFGRVDLVTENFDEFKEVSSRDGGLVTTLGKNCLFEVFNDKAFKRLERYVVGVLWGEAFKRKNYFVNEEIAEQQRDLLKNDKDKDSYEDITSNIGSKIDFVNLIKSLSDEKDVKIIEYNKDLVDLVNAQLENVQPKFIADLEKIAEKTNDIELLNQVKLTEENFNRIILEKEEAIKRAELEEKRRIDAEKKAEEEEIKRIEAEKKQKEEEEKRRQAELETARKEKERAEAELAKYKAEQNLKVEKEAHKQTEKTLEQEKDKNIYLSSTKTTSTETLELIHSVKLFAIGLDESLEKILNEHKDKLQENHILFSDISNLKLVAERVKKLSMLITKSNFKADQEVQKVNVAKYIKEYIDVYSSAYKNKVSIKYKGHSDFVTRLSILDLSIILDNLISNSLKSKAKEIEIIFKKEANALEVFFNDNGDGLDLDSFPNPEKIFDLGVKSKTEGSGIGLYSVKKKMKEMYGDIAFVGNNISLKGATFKLTFK